MAEPSLSYCAEQVRRYDKDRFLTALFAPAAQREALFALYAFNIEIARTRDVVTEPTLGLIRLQWWRDALDGIATGAPPRHQVVQPLAEAIREHGLDVALLNRLIDAREADLEQDGMANLGCLLSYAEVTGAPLAQLACQIFGATDPHSQETARLVGTAHALVGILRAVPFHAAQGRVLLPLDLLQRAKVALADLTNGKPSPGLAAVVADLAGQAGDRLAQARAEWWLVPKAALPALLPAILASRRLKALKRHAHNPFAPALARPNPADQMALAFAAMVGRW